jgi:diguanylate cyclase (GGDEF)-like protein
MGNEDLVAGYVRDLRELKEKTAKLDIAEKLAFSDPLTGTYNRRYFMQFAERVFYAKYNISAPVGIIMLDLDRFKTLNDTFGHDAGDEVLKTVTSAIQSILRESDLFARFGGEEFILLIQGLNIEKLTKLACRICKKIEAIDFFYDAKKIPITLSAGVAIRSSTSHTLERVIKQADMALYRAKANGRNRVETHIETQTQ